MANVTAPGFNERLLTAMQANGLETAEDLADAVGCSIPSARVLLKSSAPCVDAATLLRISERTHFSGRWLIYAELPTSQRVAADPEECRLLELVRGVPDDRRDEILDRILDLLHTV